MLKTLTLSLQRLVNRRAKPQPVWSGIYPSFKEVPVTGKRFATADYLADAKAFTSELLHHRPADGLASEALAAEFSLAPLLVGVTSLSGNVCILDVGGGMGVGYVSLLSCLKNVTGLRYHVLELESLAHEGSILFSGDSRIQFHHQLPQRAELGSVDLVIFCSSLQYIEDYEILLTEIFAYSPTLVYVLKIPVGDFPTFATAQYNVANTIIPVWIMNQSELVNFFAKHGYELIYKAMHDRVYDTTNFEPRYRFRKYSHLLFARMDQTG